MNPLVERLGWVLLHSLWQFALVALLAGGIIRALRRSSSAARYGVLVVAMAVSVASPVATWMLLPSDAPSDHSASRGASAPGHDANATASPAADPPQRTRLASDSDSTNERDSFSNDRRTGGISPLIAAEPNDVPSTGGLTPPVRPAHLSWSERVTMVLRPWLAWIVAGWSLGVVMCSLRPLLGWHTLWRLKRVGISPASDEVLSTMRRVSERLGLCLAVRVLQSTLAQVPVVVGYLRPVILLPVSLLTSLPAEQLEAILAHELAHVRRHDFVVNLLQTLAETLFFYHPAVWWLSRQIRIEREHCCDDLVVASFGNRVEYGRALLAIEELRGQRTVLALGAADGSLLSRVRRVVGIVPEQTAVRLSDRWPVALVTLGCLLTLALGTFVSSRAEMEPPTSERAGRGSPDPALAPTAGLPNSDEDTNPTNNANGDLRSNPAAGSGDPRRARILTEQVLGLVVDHTGRGVKGVRVRSLRRAEDGEVIEATTDDSGRFELRLLPTRVARAMIIAAVGDESRMALHQVPWDRDSKQPAKEIRLELKDSLRVDVEVADASGQPIEAASVGVIASYSKIAGATTDVAGRCSLRVPADATIEAIFAKKPQIGLDYRAYQARRRPDREPAEPPKLEQPVKFALTGIRPLSVRVLEAPSDKPIGGLKLYPWYVQKPGEASHLNLSSALDEFSVTTDPEGVAKFDWLPDWDQSNLLQIWPISKEFEHQRGTYTYKTGDGTLTMRLARLVPLTGRVAHADGKPAANLHIQARGAGYAIDGFHGSTTTDEDGRYKILAAPHQVYLLIVADQKWGAAPRTGFGVFPNQPVQGLDFVLRPATRIFGRVSVGPDNMPVANQQIHVYQYGRDLHNLKDVQFPIPEDSHRWVQPTFGHSATSDKEGRFELFVGPGQFDIRGPTQNKVEKFEVTDQASLEFNFDAPRPETGELTGLVVTGDPPRPAPNAVLYGIYRHGLAGRNLTAKTDAEGRFQTTRLRHRTVIHATDETKMLAGIVEIGPDDSTVTIPIQSLVTANARLIDEATREPLADRQITYGVKVPIGDDKAPWQTAFGGSTTTDAQGRFTIPRLIIGQTFEISVAIEKDRTSQTVGKVRPESDKPIELGDVALRRPYVAPTPEERLALQFRLGKPLGERIATSKVEARRESLRILIVFADPAAELTKQLYAALREKPDPKLSRASNDFQQMWVKVTSAEEIASAAQGMSLEVANFDKLAPPSLVVLNEDGSWRASLSLTRAADDTLDVKAVREFLSSHMLPEKDAEQLLADALARAKREDKRVFLQETASWCGPCRRLSGFIDQHREIFDAHFVWLKLDRERHTHGGDAMKRIRPGEDRGIPWIAILDADSKTLGTSDVPDGENYGFPTEPAEIQHFIQLLKQTRPSLTASELEALRTSLSNPNAAVSPKKEEETTSPPVGLEFLKPYPKLHGLSLDMTEPQFLEIVKQQDLKTRKTVDGGKATHHIVLGDGHTLIVMFDKNAKCNGIQRVRGDPGEKEQANAQEPAIRHERITVTGRALDPEGKVIASAKVWIVSARVEQKLLGNAVTNSEGRFEFRDVQLPIEENHRDPRRGAGAFEILGTAPRFGFAWRPIKWYYPDLKHESLDLDEEGEDLPFQFAGDDKIELDLKFPAAARLRGRLIDDAGKPIAGAKIGLWDVEPVPSKGYDKSGDFLRYNERGLHTLYVDKAMPAELRNRTTDADGWFEYAELPANCEFRIDVRAAGFANRMFYAATADAKLFRFPDPKVETDGFTLTLTSTRDVPVLVTYGDTGMPAPNVCVSGIGPNGSAWVVTDKDGKALLRLPPGEHRLSVRSEFKTPYQSSEDGKLTVPPKDQPDEALAIKLERAVEVEVTILDAETKQGLADAELWVEGAFGFKEYTWRSWKLPRTSMVERPRTDANGKVVFFFRPGKYVLGSGYRQWPGAYDPKRSTTAEIECRAGERTKVELIHRRSNPDPAQ